MTLLALDAAVRETGWAVFNPGGIIQTGIIRMSKSRDPDAAGRVNHLVRNLDLLVERWHPGTVAYGQPSGMRWPVPSLELLDNSLINWSERHRLPLFTYSAQEVRAALSSHARVPQDQLAFAIMRRMGLIGARKSTHEWEAMAIGYYHLCRYSRGLQVESKRDEG
ncbi:MAG: hypothetical protein F4X65_02175 [Chloroflexi bacterium]|nr:hypothetical protein [Chloroflexota bacterium]